MKTLRIAILATCLSLSAQAQITVSPSGQTAAQVQALIDAGQTVSITAYGAIADGSSHPLSSVYGSLAEAQVVYPFATSLSDEIDWAAATKALLQVPPLPAGTVDSNTPDPAHGGFIQLPRNKTIVVNRPIVLGSYQGILGGGPGSIIKNTSTNSPAILIGDSGANAVYRVVLRDFTIQGALAGTFVSGGYGIHGHRVYRSYIGHIWVVMATDDGIFLNGSGYTYIQDSYVQNNAGHGIRLLDSGGDLWVTSTYIVNNTVRINYLSGVLVDGVTAITVENNTIESNGSVGERIGHTNGLTATNRAVNLYVKGTALSSFNGNYLEQSDAYTNQTQVAVSAASYLNTFERNTLNNYIGFYLWASWNGATDSNVNYNHFEKNVFDGAVNPNFVTARHASAAPANTNWIAGNTSLNWSDQDSDYNSNTLRGADGDEGSLSGQAITSGASFTPDGGPITGTGTINDGQPKGRILHVALTANTTVNLPTNFKNNEELTFIFTQDATGGRTVAWNNEFKLADWSETGNIANNRSSIKFVFNGASFIQSSPQVPYSVSIFNVNAGFYSGQLSTSGVRNVNIGYTSGYYNVSGNNNIKIGHYSGAYATGSNELYIDSLDRANTAGDKAGAILYGVFDATPANQTLAINAKTTVGVGGVQAKNIRHGITDAMTAGVVTVTDTGCTANTRYFFTVHTIGTVAIPSTYYVTTRTASTSFVVTASVLTDTSTLDWMAIEP